MKRSAGAAHLEWLEPESDEGNVEYKLRLKDPSTMRFQQLVTQMKFRLSEGNGECFYYLGEPGASMQEEPVILPYHWSVDVHHTAEACFCSQVWRTMASPAA